MCKWLDKKILAGLYSVALFVFITAIYVFLAYVLERKILSTEIYLRGLDNGLSRQSLDIVLNFNEKYSWVSYVLTPLIILVKVSFTVICISIGFILSAVDFKAKNMFRVVLISEGVFVLAQILYVINIFINTDSITIQNILSHYPLSAVGFIGTENINAQWAIYPLQTANLFEVFYMIVIAWFLSRKSKQSFADIFSIVLPSYGLGLILWITLVAFLTFQVT